MVESSQSEAQVPHQGTTHETTDASIGGVLAAGSALLVLLAVVLFVLKGLFDFYLARDAEKKQALSPSVMREPRRPPLEPRLEGLEDLETTDPQLLAIRAASQLGFRPEDNYSAANPILDLQEGRFTPNYPQHQLYLDGKLSEVKINNNVAMGEITVEGKAFPMLFRKQGEGWRIDLIATERLEQQQMPPGFMHP